MVSRPSLSRRHFLGAVAGTGAAAALGGLAVPTASAGASAVQAASTARRTPVRTGLHELIASRYAVLRGKRVGVVANPTSVTDYLVHEVDVMHESPDVDLIAVFGPEHGFRGTAQAGGSEGTTTDPRTGLPVYDFYDVSWRAMTRAFDKADVEIVVLDLQDVGARFYTYLWTMLDVMTACAATGRPFVVLDRPNPSGGERLNGPVLQPRLETFVGNEPVAQQYAMTIGEMARLLAGEYVTARSGGHPLDLHVQAMRGWTRDTYAQDTGLEWIAPSPNLPTITSAQVYVGHCYFEGTNLSQGRGTTQPFEIVGAPYIDWRWRDALAAARLAGAEFREVAFVPTSSTNADEQCIGVQTFITDIRAYDPLRTTITMLVELKRLYPDFAWRYDTGDSLDPYWIDKLSGSYAVRRGVDAGRDADQIMSVWADDLAAFDVIRRKYLIY